jgi:hypothetical protein
LDEYVGESTIARANDESVLVVPWRAQNGPRVGSREWLKSEIRTAGGETNPGAHGIGVDDAVDCAGQRGGDPVRCASALAVRSGA